VSKILAQNIQDALLPSDDMYIEVWITLMQWAFLKLSGSKDADAMRAAAERDLQAMADQEALLLKQQPIAPAEAIWGGGASGYSLNNLR
jgi:hypothetical protein